MFSRASFGPCTGLPLGSISLAAHLTPRQPTCISIRTLQVRSALMLRNPRVLSILEGVLAAPQLHVGSLLGETFARGKDQFNLL